jgi:spore coat polysaccharide biosynthesis protein SpsF (cytidylyltransferase family)
MIGAIVQARMASTRLPGKVLLPLAGKPILWHVVSRVGTSRLIKKVVVATTDRKEDDAICDFCRKNGIDFFRGSEDDVLDRFYRAAKKFRFNAVVRVTADCPLHDPVVIDRVIGEYAKGGYDYVTNANPPTYPDGLDVEVFSFAALERAWKEARLKSEREHVTPYIRNSGLFRLGNVANNSDLSSYRWTLDQPEDFEFIKSVYAAMKKDAFGMDDVLALLGRHPELLGINAGIGRNEGYAKSLREDG